MSLGCEIKARNASAHKIGRSKNACICVRKLIKAKIIFMGILTSPIGLNWRHPATQKDAELETSKNMKIGPKTAIFRLPRP